MVIPLQTFFQSYTRQFLYLSMDKGQAEELSLQECGVDSCFFLKPALQEVMCCGFMNVSNINQYQCLQNYVAA
jgi:hypothetical protein